MAKVLVAIDNTGLSALVPKSLTAQVRPDQTEVLVLQVVQPPLYGVPLEMSPGYQPETAARRKELREQAKANLEAAVQSLRNAGFKLGSRLVESEIKEGILSVAAEWVADLIVVTSHERKGVAKFLHRSVAENIVHRAPCSVRVLKESTQKAAA